MKKKYVYVIYEVYTDDFMNLNDEKERIKYIKTLESEQEMIAYLESEKHFQCDENEGWTSVNKITDEYCEYVMYYCDKNNIE